MTSLFQNYKRRPVQIEKGEGTYVFDDAGKKYIDFTSGIAVLPLGHCHPALVDTIQKQSEKLWHTSNLFMSKGQDQLASVLVENTHLSYGFFCNSGTEANEAAIKMARKHTKKHKIISFENSFHGRTFGAMSATGQAKVHEGFGPLVEKFEYVPFNDSKALLEAVDNETAAIMLEIIQGEGGINSITPAFASMVQTICDTNNILLIIDEVQTGIGRTGTKFAYEQTVLKPHIVTLAKGLGGGFPIGAMLGTKELFDTFTAGSHGTTFGGNPLAMSVAQTVMDIVCEPIFLEGVKEKSAYFKEQLALKLPTYEVRGEGLLIGIGMDEPISEIIEKCEKEGLLVVGAGTSTLRLLPPLNVSNNEIDEAIQVLQSVLLT